MGRSSPTEERTAPSPSLTSDITLRLQQLVVGWHGVERNQPLIVLRDECLNAVGPGGRHLLPAKLLLIKNLDETNLQSAIRGLNGKGRGTMVRFHFKIGGSSDSHSYQQGWQKRRPTAGRWLSKKIYRRAIKSPSTAMPSVTCC